MMDEKTPTKLIAGIAAVAIGVHCLGDREKLEQIVDLGGSAANVATATAGSTDTGAPLFELDNGLQPVTIIWRTGQRLHHQVFPSTLLSDTA